MKTIRKSEASNRTALKTLIAFLAPVVIFAAAVIAYVPAFEGDWIWDDDTSVYSNPVVTRPDGLYRIWFTTEDYDFWPMTKTVFWAQYQFFKNDPKGYHVVNVLLHALGSVLVYFVLRRLRIPGAPLVGMIFALHPVNVASVGWVAELKNPLSMVFLAVTLLFWIAASGPRRWIWYALSLVGFALALTSKTSVVMLPVGLLGLTWWLRGRIRWRDVFLTLPFFALSGVMAAMTVFAQKRNLDILSEPLEGIYRLAGAGWTVWFYLYKALLPIRLSMIYPHWKTTIESLGWISFLPTVAVAGVLAVLWFKRKTWWARPLLFAFGYYLLAMFPVMGFFDMSITMHALVADHFQYLPIVGVIALVCAGGWKLYRYLSPALRPVITVITACVLVAVGVATRDRVEVIADKEKLWRDTIDKNPKAWMANYNLGTVLSISASEKFTAGNMLLAEARGLMQRREALGARGNHAQAELYRQNADLKKQQGQAMIQQTREGLLEAIPYYRKAIELKPTYVRPYNNLAKSLSQLGRFDEGLELYRKAVEVDKEYFPNKRNPQLLFNLGLALGNKNLLPEAAAAFREAYQLNNRFDPAFNNLLRTLQLLEQHDELLELLNRRIEARPQDAHAFRDLAIVLHEQGKTDQALPHLEQAVQLAPNDTLILATRGDILLAADRPRQAAESYAKALQILRSRSQDDPKLVMTLAVAQARSGQNAEALVNFLRVLQTDPGSPKVKQAIRDLMNRLGHTAEAATSYERALQVVPGWIEGLQKLAWIRATHPDRPVRNAPQAQMCVQELRRRVGEERAVVMDTYAAVLAESGKFPEALAAAKKALQLAKDGNDKALAKEIETRIKLYTQARPFREPK